MLHDLDVACADLVEAVAGLAVEVKRLLEDLMKVSPFALTIINGETITIKECFEF